MHSTQLKDEYVSCVSLKPFYFIYCVASFVLECFFMMNEWRQQGLHFFNFIVLCTMTIKIFWLRCRRSLWEIPVRVLSEFFNLPLSRTMVSTRWQWLQCYANHGVKGFGEVETHRRSTVPPWGGGKLSKAVATSLVSTCSVSHVMQLHFPVILVTNIRLWSLGKTHFIYKKNIK